MAVTDRPYAGEEDYQRIRSFLIDAFAIDGFGTWCTAGDLDWWRFTANDPDAIADVHLWIDAGGVVGFAWPIHGQIALVTHPGYQSMYEELVEWAEAYSLASRPPGDRAVPTETATEIWTFDGAPRVSVLEQRGYQPSGAAIHYLRQAVERPMAVPRLPPGYSLRHVAGEDDVERRVAVHRDAFAPSRMTVAKHRAVMAAPTYRPDLDLIVEAPDGSFAAFTIVWHDPVNRIGVFEPVGCHSAHRRQGLGRAIMQEGLRRLADLGATTAFVGTNSDNLASAALYASVGFQPFRTNRAWTKRLAYRVQDSVMWLNTSESRGFGQ